MAVLVAGSTDVDASSLTLWIDADITPLDEVVKSFEAMPFPRFAKTHTPLDGVPVGPSRRYITVYRHPIDAMTLAAVAHHYACAATVKTEPNVLMLHYADMTRDPGHTIRRIAEHLVIDVDQGTVDAIAEATSFSSMKAAAGRFAPHAADGIYHEIARIEATLSTVLDPTTAHWLMWGDGPP